MVLIAESARQYTAPGRAEIYNQKARRFARRNGFDDCVIRFFYSFDKKTIAFKVISKNGHEVATKYLDYEDKRCFYGVFKS